VQNTTVLSHCEAKKGQQLVWRSSEVETPYVNLLWVQTGQRDLYPRKVNGHKCVETRLYPAAVISTVPGYWWDGAGYHTAIKLLMQSKEKKRTDPQCVVPRMAAESLMWWTLMLSTAESKQCSKMYSLMWIVSVVINSEDFIDAQRKCKNRGWIDTYASNSVVVLLLSAWCKATWGLWLVPWSNDC